MSVLGLTSGDFESHAAATRRERETRMSTMRFEAGPTATTTVALPPSLAFASDTSTSGFSYPHTDDSVTDIRKGGKEVKVHLGDP